MCIIGRDIAKQRVVISAKDVIFNIFKKSEFKECR